MDKYSLDKDIQVKNVSVEEDDDKWAVAPEPEEMVEIDNLRLDPDAASRYLKIRKARENNSRAKQGYHRR